METRRGRSALDSETVEPRLLHRGAEADLYLSTLGPWEVIVKKRVNKSYRIGELDTRIRKERTVREASVLHEAKKAGVRSPALLDIDLEDYAITMSYIRGKLARDSLDQLEGATRLRLFRDVGRQIGLLHLGELVHGDMTTSNIIISEAQTPFILDFGMAHHSLEPEDRGTDLHLLHRSIATSHVIDTGSCLRALSKGYRETAGAMQAKRSFAKAAEIARRGRYFALR